MVREPVLHSAEAERALLGALLLDSTKLSEVAELIGPGDFFRDAHGQTFALMQEMVRGEKPLDMTALCIEAMGIGPDRYGGVDYLSRLPEAAVSPESVLYHAGVVRDFSQRRAVLSMMERALDLARSGGDLASVREMLGSASREGGQSAGGWRPFGDHLDEEVQRIQAAAERGGELAGISTGFPDIDRLLGGVRPEMLWIVGARPGVGKTSFAAAVAIAVARAGGGVGFFSLEMPGGQIAGRALASEARIDSGALRLGRMTADQWRGLYGAGNDLAGLPVWMEDRPGLTVAEIGDRARRLKEQHPEFILLVVDYIGLIRATDTRAPREQQVAATVRALKGLARELGVTVLALSQLNREVEGRSPPAPRPSDLRESGAIEQDADVIMLLWRPEMSAPGTRPGEAEVIVCKNRHGATGTVVLAFRGEYTRFDSMARPGQWERR